MCNTEGNLVLQGLVGELETNLVYRIFDLSSPNEPLISISFQLVYWSVNPNVHWKRLKVMPCQVKNVKKSNGYSRL